MKKPGGLTKREKALFKIATNFNQDTEYDDLHEHHKICIDKWLKSATKPKRRGK